MLPKVALSLSINAQAADLLNCSRQKEKSKSANIYLPTEWAGGTSIACELDFKLFGFGFGF